MADPKVNEEARRERIRALKGQGYPEVDAIKAVGEDRDEPDEDESPESEAAEEAARQFVIVTRDFSGLGWAKKLLEEGESVVIATTFDEDDKKLNKAKRMVGEGWVEVIDLDNAITKLTGDHVYWVFAENCYVDKAKKLIAAGVKVFPTSIELGDRMEHDRQFAVEVCEQAGLQSPPTEQFESREDGLAFLDDHPNNAYVFKPDDSGGVNFSTFVPVRKDDADANRELYEYLLHMKEEPGTFILQQRIPIEDALEVNCEAWFYEGEPFLASLGLEVKRKNTYDIGEMSGCAGDFTQFIPLDSELVKQTIGKLFPFYKEQKYTGFADVNVLFTKDGTPYFLEVCNRFGYNAHPNMFLALAKDGFGDLIDDFVEGHVEGMAKRFHTDVGCSLTLFIDHPRVGLPVHIDDDYREQFYPFDGYMEDDQLLLTEYSTEIGIFLGRGKDIPAAWKSVRDAVVFDEAVSVPDMYYRFDLDDDNYYNAPILRMKEIKKRGLL